MAAIEKHLGLAFYGLFVTIASFLAIVFCAFVVGELFSFSSDLMVWDHDGEYGPWMGIVFAMYSIYGAIPLNLFLTWRILSHPHKKKSAGH